MKWHKLTLNREQIGNGALLDVRNRFAIDCNFLKNASAKLYIERQGITGPQVPVSLYFPPDVANCSREILNDYDGKECEEPDASSVDIWIGTK